MTHSTMDLNAEIMRGLSMTPAESADRSVSDVLGEHYQFVSTPHLNPTPDEQVALQQVSPRPQYDVRVRPIAKRDFIPNRTWKNESYVVSHENGNFTLIQTSPRSFLGIKLADKEHMMHTTKGANGGELMISYLDNSNLPSGVITNLTNRLAASAGIRLGKVLSEVRTTGTFTSAMYVSNDYVAQVSPTGMVEEGFYGTDYAWGNTINDLPNF